MNNEYISVKEKEGHVSIDDVMSNFDHEIDKKIENQLRQGNCYAGYPAWDFHGQVYWENDRFYCEVRRYGYLVDVISADTLEELMGNVSGEYGWD